MTLVRWIVSAFISAGILWGLVFLIMPRLPAGEIPSQAFYPIFTLINFVCALFAYLAIPNHKGLKKG